MSSHLSRTGMRGAPPEKRAKRCAARRRRENLGARPGVVAGVAIPSRAGRSVPPSAMAVELGVGECRHLVERRVATGPSAPPPRLRVCVRWRATPPDREEGKVLLVVVVRDGVGGEAVVCVEGAVLFAPGVGRLVVAAAFDPTVAARIHGIKGSKGDSRPGPGPGRRRRRISFPSALDLDATTSLSSLLRKRASNVAKQSLDGPDHNVNNHLARLCSA